MQLIKLINSTLCFKSNNTFLVNDFSDASCVYFSIGVTITQFHFQTCASTDWSDLRTFEISCCCCGNKIDFISCLFCLLQSPTKRVKHFCTPFPLPMLFVRQARKIGMLLHPITNFVWGEGGVSLVFVGDCRL